MNIQSPNESSESSADEKRTFNFSDERDDNSLIIIIHEKYSTGYGMYLWPSAPVLAQFIWYFRDIFKDKTIIELGSGTSLPGIVASKIGAKNVILTDSNQLPDCLELCNYNARVNKCDTIKVMPLTWGVINKQLIELTSCDYIISSDCFYDPKDFEDIIVTVSFIIDKNPNESTVFYTSYHERCSDWNIQCLLNQWQLTCEYIDLKSFNGDDCPLGGSQYPGRHTIRLLKIYKTKTNQCTKV